MADAALLTATATPLAPVAAAAAPEHLLASKCATEKATIDVAPHHAATVVALLVVATMATSTTLMDTIMVDVTSRVTMSSVDPTLLAAAPEPQSSTELVTADLLAPVPPLPSHQKELNRRATASTLSLRCKMSTRQVEKK